MNSMVLPIEQDYASYYSLSELLLSFIKSGKLEDEASFLHFWSNIIQLDFFISNLLWTEFTVSVVERHS